MATTHAHKKRKHHRENRKPHSDKYPVRKSIFGEVDQTKEYTIYWFCDSTTVQHDEYEISETKLRGIVDYLREISDVHDLEKMDVENVFLVTNIDSFNNHFDRLTTLDRIRLVYVYEDHDGDTNQKNRSASFGQCPKVRGPFQDLNELFSTLSKDVRTMICQPNMLTEVPSLTSASKTVERSTTAAYSYVTDWYINLIRALQDVPPARSCKEKFVEECCILYANNPSILQAIEEFSKAYVPEEAVRWYTRDGFLYKVLNRILREQNQQAIQLLHFLIYDLNRQLKDEVKTTIQDWTKADNVRLYRGQLMSSEELQQLRNNKGEELFVNSFLSMTTDLAVANMFSGAGAFAPDDLIQSVIFHIEWADFNLKQGPADIHRLSYNADEGEILLSPTYTVNLLDCVYDEKERVWNATFSRIAQTDDPLIRINDDERLMRLELALRYLIEEKDSLTDDMEDMLDTSSASQDDKFEFTSRFCSTFVEDVPILLHELELPELCSITLNDDVLDRFQLTALRSFTANAFDHGPTIHDEMVITLYDALGSTFKMKGKLMEAYYYYHKAAIYDKPQSQTTYTRQAHLAQIHKLNGDYELAWNIFDELMDRTNDTDNFLYQDIAFARSKNMSDNVFLQNSRAFLHYCSMFDDKDDSDEDEAEIFIDEKIEYVIDAWAELGYKYFYQSHDAQQALDCYTREKKLSVTASKSCSSYFNPLIGSCSERMGDVYASENNIDKSLTLYQEALDLSLQGEFHMNMVTAARCMCKIGRYRPTHQSEIFYRAFQYLLNGYGKPYIRDTIGKCYVHLSRSLQRCERYQQALKYAQQALSVFLPDPLLLERLVDDCCQLLIELHQTIFNDTENLPTKMELLENRITSNDLQIKSMLDTTLDELKNDLNNEQVKAS